MRIWGRIALAALAFGVLPAAASAATAEGTVITNVVSATYSTVATPEPGSGYSVSYSATAQVLTQDPCININKFSDPAGGQVAGEVVTFRIWVYNCSASASALNILIYDQIPLNTTKSAATYNYDPPTDWQIGYSTTGPDGPYTIGTDPELDGNGLNWLRCRLSRLGPNKSAWVAYQVTIQ